MKFRSESGIASTMVALLAVVLIGSSAFAVDFGIAYWNRNTLQTVTDSGSLAAAKVIAEYRGDANGDGLFGTCADVKAEPAIVQAAYDAAIEKASQNEWFGGVQPRQLSPTDGDDGKIGFEIICDDPAAPNSILVEFWADGVSPAVLGPIIGSGAVTTVAAATSEIGVPRSGYGLRPYFVCGNRVQKLEDELGNPTGWVQLRHPDDEITYNDDAARTVNDASIDKNSTTLTSATAVFTTDDVGAQVVVVGADNAGKDLETTIASVTDATTVELTDKAGSDVTNAELTITPVDSSAGSCFIAPGDWWTADCPTDTNNGTLAENTARGCLSEIAILDPGAADPTDQASMLPILQSACAATNDDPEDCLSGNPGNVGANPVINAWDDLLGTEIALPVFNEDWQNWMSDAGVCGGGNGACYAIEELLAVRVCGYEWAGNKDNSSPDPECAGVDALLGTGGNDNYLYLKLVTVITGNVSGAFECPPGDPSCDSGLRAIRLSR